MSLRLIVAALGGDLYQNGRRANVPAPGHSEADRSVSLFLSGDRVVAHGFGAADWRDVLQDLKARGLVDRDGRLTGATATSGPLPPDRRRRIATALRLWGEAHPLLPDDLAAR